MQENTGIHAVAPGRRGRRPPMVLALAATAACALAVTSCATGTQPKSAEGAAGSFSADATLSGELQIMGFNTEADEVAETRSEAARKAIDPVKVKAVEGDLDVQQFLSSVASGDAPDLIYANRDQLGTFASRKAIMPLDECISGESINTADFRDTALAQGTFQDHVYGIPEFNQVQILMANNDLLKKAGLDTGDVDGSDWDAVTSAGKKLTAKNGNKLSVIGFDSKLPEFLPLWAKANGADLISADGRTAQLDDPKVIEALQFAVGIYTDQGGFGTVKAFRDSADFFGKGNQFATSVLGAMPMEQWYVNILNDVSPDAPMAFTTFKTREDKPLSFASGSAWAIPTAGKNPQAACRYIKTMTDTGTWMKAAQARVDTRTKDGKPFTGLFTGNKMADDQIKADFVDKANSLDGPWADAVAASYEANESSFSMPASPADAEFKQAWIDAVNRVLNGDATPEDSLAAGQQEAQKALDDGWKAWDAGDKPQGEG